MLQMHMTKRFSIGHDKARTMDVFAPHGMGNAENGEHKHGSNRSCTESTRHSDSRDERDANEHEADSSKLEDAWSSMAWNTKARREQTGTLIDTQEV